MWLYPRIAPGVGEALASERATISIRALSKVASTAHSDAVYGPTGGGRVSVAHLEQLRARVVAIATRLGFPDRPGEKQRSGYRPFDAECAELLHTTMAMTPAEASQMGVWTFLATVLLPDVTRWRFPGEPGKGTSTERFTGGVRGLRNTFGRLWWRAHLLRADTMKDPYAYVKALGEDELVQVTERPNVAGNPRVNVTMCRAFLAVASERSRSEVLRDGMKRMRRLSMLVALHALDDAVLDEMVTRVMRDAARAIQTRAA